MPWKRIREISFAGCGVLNFYQAGVCERLIEEIPPENIVWSGASAGAGMSIVAALGIPPRAVVDSVMAELGRHPAGAKLRPAWAQAIGERFIEDFLRPGDFERLRGRVSISISRLQPLSNLLITEFHDDDDLHDAIRASCHWPWFSQWTSQFRGMPCVDGGITNNQPRRFPDALCVSPFHWGSSDSIGPSRVIDPLNAFLVPSSRSVAKWLSLGRRDADVWLREGRRVGPRISLPTLPAQRFIA